MENLEDTYGDHVKISFKVLDKTKIEKDDLKDVRDDIEDDYDLDNVKVTDGYEVCVKVTIKGSDEKRTFYRTYDVYKVNGKWSIVD